jgi:DNA modification methylase
VFYAGDAVEVLATLPAASVDCLITSPPYWRCRDYGVPPRTWSDGVICALGLEPTPDSYIAHLLEVIDQLHRVLKDSGTFWLNIADVYCAASVGTAPGCRPPFQKAHARSPAPSVARKSLCLLPERLALAMVSNGWVLRNRVVWHKPDHVPSSVKDRLTCSWEYLYFFTKLPRYHFDLDAVRVPHTTKCKTPARERVQGPSLAHRMARPPRDAYHALGKNPADVWSIAPETRGKGHPAAFPLELCRRPILAGCPPGGVVLDPFCGSGTACVAAAKLGRRFIGVDANPAYIEIARRRCQEVVNADLRAAGPEVAA